MLFAFISHEKKQQHTEDGEDTAKAHVPKAANAKEEKVPARSPEVKGKKAQGPKSPDAPNDENRLHESSIRIDFNSLKEIGPTS